MKAVLTDERFSHPDWIYERKLDGIRCIAIRDGDAVRLLSRNDLSLDGRYPELVQALARRAGRQLRDRRRGGGLRRRADQLLAALPARPAAGAGVPLRVRPALARRPRRAPAAAALAQAAAARAAGLPRRHPAHPAPQREGRGAVRRGVREGLGGADRQARRQPLRRLALQGLAEVQVRPQPGAGDRRLHRAEGLARGAGRAAHRLLRGRRAALRGQGGHRLRRRHAEGPRRRGWAAAALRPAVRRRPRDQGPHGHLGRARAGGPDRLRRVDAATAGCATRASSACASTSRLRKVVREG